MPFLDVLVPLLRSRFPNLQFTEPSAKRPQLIIPAAHPDVGDVVLLDDEEEITAYIGHFTHSHFANYDDIPSVEKKKIIAEDVLRFLEDLFADRVVMWGSHRGMGGWYSIDRPSLPSIGHKKYVWSGPQST
jgi:hypothetical protein